MEENYYLIGQSIMDKDIVPHWITNYPYEADYPNEKEIRKIIGDKQNKNLRSAYYVYKTQTKSLIDKDLTEGTIKIYKNNIKRLEPVFTKARKLKRRPMLWNILVFIMIFILEHLLKQFIFQVS